MLGLVRLSYCTAGQEGVRRASGGGQSVLLPPPMLSLVRLSYCTAGQEGVRRGSVRTFAAPHARLSSTLLLHCGSGGGQEG
eukprot:236228-Prorocentrum_minimum.AAC.1